MIMDSNFPKNKFALTIWTINGILFLLGALLLLGIIAFNLFKDINKQEAPEHKLEGIAGSARNDEKWSLRRSFVLSGTEYITLELSSDKSTVDSLGARINDYGSSYSDYRAHPAKNIIFINTKNNDRQWLFKNNDQLILENRDIDFKKENADEKITQIIIYSIINRDTNADGVLNAKDGVSLGASHPSGEKYVGLIEDVQQLISIARIDSDNLLIIYQKNGEALTAELNIKEITISNIMALPIVGE